MKNKERILSWPRLVLRTICAFLVSGGASLATYVLFGIGGFWDLLIYAVSNFLFVVYVVHYAEG